MVHFQALFMEEFVGRTHELKCVNLDVSTLILLDYSQEPQTIFNISPALGDF